MEIICYNKGTKERNEQKMFISFKKNGEYTDAQLSVGRGVGKGP